MILQDQPVKHAEITARVHAVQTAQRIRIRGSVDLVQGIAQIIRRTVNPGVFRHQLVVAQEPSEGHAGVGGLGADHIPGDRQGAPLDVGDPVLLPPQKDIPPPFPLHAALESAVLREKRKPDAAFRRVAHESGTGSLIAEGDDVVEVVERIPPLFLPLFVLRHVNHDIFTVQSQIRVRDRDIQRVEQLSHRSLASQMESVYARADGYFCSLGRQISRSEQERHFALVFTRGV